LQALLTTRIEEIAYLKKKLENVKKAAE
jgi:hypothetical protein